MNKRKSKAIYKEKSFFSGFKISIFKRLIFKISKTKDLNILKLYIFNMNVKLKDINARIIILLANQGREVDFTIDIDNHGIEGYFLTDTKYEEENKQKKDKLKLNRPEKRDKRKKIVSEGLRIAEIHQTLGAIDQTRQNTNENKKRTEGYAKEGLKRVLNELIDKKIVEKRPIKPKTGKTSRKNEYFLNTNKEAFNKIISICYKHDLLYRLVFTDYFLKYGSTYLVAFIEKKLGFDLINYNEIITHKIIGYDNNNEGEPIYEPEEDKKLAKAKEEWITYHLWEIIRNSPLLIKGIINDDKKTTPQTKEIITLLKNKGMDNEAIFQYLIMCFSITDTIMGTNPKKDFPAIKMTIENNINNIQKIREESKKGKTKG
ncbi:MAG: hypothetical protein ABIJ18_02830 [archaeon]